MQTKLSPNGITAVLFDLDGTLHHVAASTRTLSSVKPTSVAGADPDSVHAYWAQSPEMLQDQATYGGLSDEFWSYYTCLTLLQFGCPEAQARNLGPQVNQRMQDEYQPADHIPPDAWETLESLARPASPWGWSPTGAIPMPNNWQPWD